MSAIRNAIFACVLIGAIAGVVIGGVMSQPIDRALLTNIERSLVDLKRTEERIKIEALALRAGSVLNYDKLNTAVGLSETLIGRLREQMALIDPARRVRIDPLVADYAAKARDRRAAIDDFKRVFAAYKNSLIYFPHGVEEARAALAGEPRLANAVATYGEAVLANELRVRIDDSGLGPIRDRLAAEAGSAASGALALRLIDHGETLNSTSAETDALLRSVIVHPSFEASNAIVAAFDRFISDSRRELERGGDFVIAGVCALFGCLLGIAFRLQAARREAVVAGEAKSAFLASMSHEIRTPLNGVITTADLLAQTRLSEEQHAFASTIASSGRTLLALINDVLDFSKMEAGKLGVSPIDASIASLIDDVGANVAAKASAKGLTLTTWTDPRLPETAQFDPLRLSQVLSNILDNAVKFTETGDVSLSAAMSPDTAGEMTLRVTDTGIGMTEEQAARVFAPFVQADASITRRYGGTGLGLSISQYLVEAMGGAIAIASQPGSGTTFAITLPLVTDSPAAAPQRWTGAKVAICVGTPPHVHVCASYAEAEGAVISGYPETTDDLAALDFDFAIVDDPWLRAISMEDRSFAHSLTGKAAGVIALTRFDHTSSGSLVVEGTKLARIRTPIRRGVLANAGMRILDPSAGLMAPTETLLRRKPPRALAEAAAAIVLVVEDNETNQFVIGKLLDQIGVWHDLAEDGASAHEMYRPDRHGLVLTDLHMPRLDGFNLTQAIRRGERDGAPRRPVVALTADVLEDTARRCREAGIDGYLTKPVGRDALEAAIGKYAPGVILMRGAWLQEGPTAMDADGSSPAPDDPWSGDAPAPVDLEIIADIFGGLDADAQQAIARALDDFDAALPVLRAALADTDFAKLRDRAHKCAGGARALGLVDLAQSFGAIEAAVTANAPAEASDILADIPAAIDTVRRFIGGEEEHP